MAWQSLPIRSSVARALHRLSARRAGGVTLLISGAPGLYQEPVALHLAQAFLCEQRDGDACGACSACKRVSTEVHPDLLLFRPAGANHRIDDLRVAKEQAQLHPYEADRKVLAIMRADRMLQEGANSLLKVLEEPPDHVLFVLSTDHHEAILPTILSRCRHVRLSPLARDDLAEWLIRTHDVEQDRAHAIARLAGGRPALAEDLLHNDWADQRDAVLDMVESVRRESSLAVVTVAQKFAKDRAKAREFLATLLALVRDGLMLREGIAPESLIHRDRTDRMTAMWDGNTPDRMIECFESTAEGIRRLDGNHNISATLEGVLRSFLG